MAHKRVACKFTYREVFLALSATVAALFLHNASAYAQSLPLSFERLSLDNGLSQTTVLCLAQDKNGFIWLGTEDGLNRYDGYSFKVFKHNPKQSGSLSNSLVRALHCGQDGTLWIGTLGGGLNRFNPQTQTFTRFLHDANTLNSLSSNAVTCLLQDTSGNLWIGTSDGGLNRFNPQTQTFTRFLHDANTLNSLSSNAVTCLFQDTSGNLWIGTSDGGLNRFNPQTQTFTRFLHDANTLNSLSSNAVTCLLQDTSGNLWIGTSGGGLNRFNPQTQTFTHFLSDPSNAESLSDNDVFSLCGGAANELWVGTIGGGLNRFNLQTQAFTRYVRTTSATSLSSNAVIALMRDAAGAVWIGTDNGVNRLDLGKEKFDKFTAFGAVASLNIQSIYEDTRGVLWLGTDGNGLFSLDRKNRTFKNYISKPDGVSLQDNRIFSIYEDRAGVLWIGAFGGLLHQLDRSSGKFKTYSLKQAFALGATLENNAVSAIYEDRSGTLWIATEGSGLFSLDAARRQVRSFSVIANDTTSISSNVVQCIIEDRAGAIWIGTAQGICRYDATTDKFARYFSSIIAGSGLPNNDVLSLYGDASGNLWIGTLGGGLSRFTPQTGTVVTFSEADGLINDVVYGILEDARGNLWCSTNRGLSKFNPHTKSFRNYDMRDGLQGNQFNQGAFFKSPSGELFFGGVSGLNSFFPEKVQDNSFEPPVSIVDFKIFDRPVDDARLDSVIQLSYAQNFFSFEFVGLNFRFPEKNRYAYKLDGFDNDWVDCGTRRYAAYTNLNPGEYVFRVKASNNDGIWNERGATVRLIITPPFWQTAWFRVFAVVGTIGVSVFLYRKRISDIELRNQRLESEVAQRTAELKQKTQLVEVQRDELKHALDELKHTQAQLVQSEKMASLGQLTAGIAHEINNPINFVSASIKPLRRNISSVLSITQKYDDLLSASELAHVAEEIRRYKNDLEFEVVVEELQTILRNIENGAKRTTEIVRSLRNFSRLDEDVLKCMNIHDGIDSTLELLTNQLKNRVEVVKNYGDVPEVECYPGQLNQVFMNVLANAAQAIEGNGSIFITTARVQDTVRLSFKDTGKGISPDVKMKIFDPFFTTKKIGEGTGLGLSITFGIIKKHHGTVEARSEGVDKGAEFIITLPIAQPMKTAD